MEFTKEELFILTKLLESAQFTLKQAEVALEAHRKLVEAQK